MDLGDDEDRRPTIADVPGLIEGASAGAGLGHAFLRHVERTRVLVHVVDGAARDPAWDYDVIREELRLHDPALLDKPLVVAFNKMDLPEAREAWPAFSAARRSENVLVRRHLRRRRRRPRRAPRAARRAPPRRGGPRGRARAGGSRRPPHRRRRGRLHAGARGRRLPRPRQADRADRRPDELRGRGIGRALPARPRPPRDRRRAAPGRRAGRRHRPDRSGGVRMGPSAWDEDAR